MKGKNPHNRPVIVSNFGLLYRVARSKYKKLLTEVANGKTVNLDDYGKCIGQLQENLTDVDPEQAKDLLKELEEQCK